MSTRLRAARAASSLAFRPFRGGLLVIAGPALEGKAVLASALSELIPDVVQLGRPDDLASGRRTAESELIEEAVAAWRRRTTPSTTVLLTGRFGTPALRRRAAHAAREERMDFLLVEATSSAIRSLRRVSRMFLRPDEAVTRMERYERARSSYVSLTSAELDELPALRLRTVLADVDAAAHAVAHAWAHRSHDLT